VVTHQFTIPFTNPSAKYPRPDRGSIARSDPDPVHCPDCIPNRKPNRISDPLRISDQHGANRLAEHLAEHLAGLLRNRAAYAVRRFPNRDVFVGVRRGGVRGSISCGGVPVDVHRLLWQDRKPIARTQFPTDPDPVGIANHCM
jgi:hypothetical protein